MNKILLKLPNIVLGTDLWKNRKKQYFLAITAHFFDYYLNYRSILYSFRRFENYHFSSKITTFIQKQLGPGILEKVNSNYFYQIFYLHKLFNSLIINKVVSITTDNEACMKRACRDISDDCIRLSCLAHNLNLIVQYGLKIWDKPAELYVILINRNSFL